MREIYLNEVIIKRRETTETTETTDLLIYW